jgi:hypothetical protein
MTAQEFDIEKAKIRKVRIGLLKAYTQKLKTAMNRLRPGDASWSEVTGGLRMVIDQLRFEYRATDSVEAPPAAGDEQQAGEEKKPFAGIRLKLHRPTGT